MVSSRVSAQLGLFSAGCVLVWSMAVLVQGNVAAAEAWKSYQTRLRPAAANISSTAGDASSTQLASATALPARHD